jgi:hypothetical protein
VDVKACVSYVKDGSLVVEVAAVYVEDATDVI